MSSHLKHSSQPPPGPPTIRHGSGGNARRSQREEFWSTVLESTNRASVSTTSRSLKKPSTTRVVYASPISPTPSVTEARSSSSSSPTSHRSRLRLPGHLPAFTDLPALHTQPPLSSSPSNPSHHHHHHHHHYHHHLSSSSPTSRTDVPSDSPDATQSPRKLKPDRKTRPYKCEVCRAAYTQKGDMVRHMRYVHEGIRPYQCPHCGNSFGRRSILNKHIKTHSKE